jgi:Sec-independent protein secretion pathway component TatC
MKKILEFQIELKWRFFYIFLTYFFTFICCIDSWEYLLMFEVSFLKRIDVQITNLIYPNLTDGQSMIYLLSAYYAFFISSPFIFIQVLIFFGPGFFFEEIKFVTYFFLTFCLNFFGGIMANQFIFFPLIFKDLLQYQYLGLNDRALEIKMEYLMNLKDILQLKIKTSFFLGFFFNLPFFIYFLGKVSKTFFFLIMKLRKIFYFLSFIFFLFFYETDFYLFFLFYFFFCFIFEGSFFLILYFFLLVR